MTPPENLKWLLSDVVARAQSTPAGPCASYWYARPHDDFPPGSLVAPEEFSGGPVLRVLCTHTGLPAKAQKEVSARWCEILPTLSGVRTLWLAGKASPALFEAACAVPSLEGLHLTWSDITSLEPLRFAPRLRYLHLGSMPGLTDLTPLAHLSDLRWLQVEDLRQVTDLSDLGALEGLEALGFTGAEGKRQTVASLGPLAALTSLRWLHLGAIHVADGSLSPLTSLTNLQWLGVGRFFAWEEFAKLAGALPAAECMWFQPSVDGYVRCKRCKTPTRTLSGVGLRKACPQCDSGRLAAFAAQFEAMRRGA
jgi:hypothetical protein